MKNVNIMGIKYTVKLISVGELFKVYDGTAHLEAVKSLFGQNLENFSGLCDAMTETIFINRDMSDEKKKKTLLHEIMEAFDQESLTELSHLQIQTIANAFFIMGLVNLEELLQDEPIEISTTIDTAG